MRERGFSLIEVLVAVGVTSSIIITLAGLFVLGSREVRSGRLLTEATQTANGLMEEMQTLHIRDLYGLTNAASTATTASWSSDQAIPTYSGEHTDYTTDYTAMLNRWRTQVQGSVLPNAGFSYTVTAFTNRPVGSNPGTTTFANARFARVELTIFWREGKQRNREVTFDLLKF